MIDVTKIPAGVLSDVRQFVRDNDRIPRRDHSAAACDAYIASCSAEEVLDMYLCWNGIIGWTHTVLRTVHALDEAAK